MRQNNSYAMALLGDHITVLTDYHANGSYKKLKENIELLDEKDYAVMIRTTNFEKNDFTCDLKYINKHAYEFLAKSKVEPGDILMNKIANAGSVYYMPDLKRPVSLAMNLFLIRTNYSTTNQRYIYYYLKANESLIKTYAIGTAATTITKQSVRNLRIYLPSLIRQNKVVAILSAYEALIENNLRRIKILEEMAQNLYREWLVNFRFPGHEQIRFVDSPLGRIPEGWEVLEFRNLFDIKYGKTLPKTKISKHGLYPVYGAGDIIGYYDQMICAKKCVLVTSRGNGSGTVWRTRGAAFITNNSLIIKPKPGFNHWDYTFIELLLKNSNVMEAKTGSAQPQVTIENLNYVKGLVPESKCVERFCAIALPIYEFIDRCLINNNILRQTRDLLLPKLISGEVDVLELDIKVPEEKAV